MAGEGEKIVKILEDIRSNLNAVSSAQNTASASTRKLSKDEADLVGKVAKTSDAVDAQGKKLVGLSKVLAENHQQITKYGKGFVAAGASMMAFSGLAALPIKAAGMLDRSFGGAFKTVGEFENKIFLTSQSLKAMGAQMGSLTSIQKTYSSGIDDISSKTLLSRKESELLFGSLLKGMKGARGGIETLKDGTKVFTGQAAALKSLATMSAQLGGSYEETAQKAQRLGQAMSQYAEVQKMIEEIKKGGMSGSSMSQLVLMGEMNPQMQQQIQDMMELNENIGRGKAGVGRESFVIGKETQQQKANAELKIQQDLVKKELVKLTQQLSKSTYAWTESNSALMSSMMVWGKGLEIAGGVALGVGGGMMGAGAVGSRLAGGRGGGKMFAAAAGLLPGAFGSLGGAAGVASGSVTPVFVTNAGAIGKGMMGGGGFGGRKGSWLKKALGIGAVAVGTAGAAAAGAYGASSLYGAWEQGDPEYRGMSAEEKQRKIGGIKKKGFIGGAISGLATGAGIGAMGANPFTVIAGALIGGVVGALGTMSIADFFDKNKGAKAAVKEPIEQSAAVDKERQKLGKAYSLLMQGIQEARRATAFTIQKAQFAAGAAGTEAGAFAGGGVGFRGQAGAAMQKQAAAMQTEAVQRRTVAAAMKDTGEKGFGADLQKQIENAKQEMSLLTDEVAIGAKKSQIAGLVEQEKNLQLTASKELAAALNLEIGAFKKNMEAAVQESKALQESAAAQTSYASAMRDYHNELRLGIGVSYKDQLNVVKALKTEASAAWHEVSATQKLYDKAMGSGNLKEAKTLEIELRKQEAKAIQKETAALREAKGMREGYLDAIKAEVFGMGGYTEFVAERGSGAQFFGEAAGVGGKGKSAIGGPARYTKEGLRFAGGQEAGTDAYTKQFQSFLGKSMGEGAPKEALNFLWSPGGPQEAAMKGAGGTFKGGEQVGRIGPGGAMTQAMIGGVSAIEKGISGGAKQAERIEGHLKAAADYMISGARDGGGKVAAGSVKGKGKIGGPLLAPWEMAPEQIVESAEKIGLGESQNEKVNRAKQDMISKGRSFDLGEGFGSGQSTWTRPKDYSEIRAIQQRGVRRMSYKPGGKTDMPDDVRRGIEEQKMEMSEKAVNRIKGGANNAKNVLENILSTLKDGLFVTEKDAGFVKKSGAVVSTSNGGPDPF